MKIISLADYIEELQEQWVQLPTLKTDKNRWWRCGKAYPCQAWIAREINVKKNTVGYWCTGFRRPSPANMAALSTLFKSEIIVNSKDVTCIIKNY